LTVIKAIASLSAASHSNHAPKDVDAALHSASSVSLSVCAAAIHQDDEVNTSTSAQPIQLWHQAPYADIIKEGGL
jgi:hypothetical protein